MAGELKASDLVTGIPDLAKEWEKLNEQMKTSVDIIVKGKKVFENQSKSQSDLADKTKEVSDAQKEVEKINKRANKVTLESVKASEALRKKRKELTEQVRKDSGEVKKSTSFTQKLTKAWTTSILKVTALIGALKLLIDAGKAYIANIKEINAQTSKVAATFDISRANAEALTKEMRGLAAAFGQDFNDVLKTSTVLSKEFGLTGRQALRLIEQGFEKGANINGEFLELLKEYPAQLKTVGLSAKQSIALITQTERAGIFSDKGIDAIKEAGIRLRELTPATKTALEAIGLSGTEIQKQLESGEKTLFEVTQEVSAKMAELPPQSKEVGTAIADIFGGPGEDVGIRFLGTLKDINLELGDIESTLSPVEASSAALNKQWQQTKDEFTKGAGLGAKALAFLQRAATDALFAVKDAASGFKTLRGVQEDNAIALEEAAKQEVLAAENTKEAEAKKRLEYLETLRIRKLYTSAQAKLVKAEAANEKLIQDILADNQSEIQKDIEETIDAAERLSFEIVDLDKDIANRILETTKLVDEQIKKRAEDLRDSISDALNFAGDLTQTFFDFRNNQRQLELQDIDIQKEAEIAAAGESAAAREAIENKFAAKQKKLKTEQAKADKRQAIFKTVIDTASAIVEALPNVALSIFAGVLGAAQLAEIVATPIPAFKDGGKMLESGLAKFSEYGPELAISPGGQAILTPQKETIGFIPKGTQFFSHDSPETQQVLKEKDSRELEVLKSIDKKLSNQNNSGYDRPVMTPEGVEYWDKLKRIRKTYLDNRIR